MHRGIDILEVKESKEVLQKRLRYCSTSVRPRIKMLLLLLKGTMSNMVVAAKVGVNRNCIAAWKLLYERGGLSALLQEKRGGNRQGAISSAMHQKIQQRLSDPKGGFISYKEATQWINESFGLQMKYKTVYQYLRYHFDSKLKVARKSHIQKDPLAEAAFKKGAHL